MKLCTVTKILGSLTKTISEYEPHDVWFNVKTRSY